MGTSRPAAVSIEDSVVPATALLAHEAGLALLAIVDYLDHDPLDLLPRVDHHAADPALRSAGRSSATLCSYGR
jgi:hypothetical protein